MVTIRVRSASGALSDSPNLERAAAPVRTKAPMSSASRCGVKARSGENATIGTVRLLIDVL